MAAPISMGSRGRLYRKGKGKEAKLCYAGVVWWMGNHQGHGNGRARSGAVGTDKAYDTHDFVEQTRPEFNFLRKNQLCQQPAKASVSNLLRNIMEEKGQKPIGSNIGAIIDNPGSLDLLRLDRNRVINLY